jgi:hypothetical protein
MKFSIFRIWTYAFSYIIKYRTIILEIIQVYSISYKTVCQGISVNMKY